MEEKGQRLIDSCKAYILAGPPDQMRRRISDKARNAVQVERERERKKTPQTRKWNAEVWAGIFAIAAKELSAARVVSMFEDLHTVVVGLRRDGYEVEADCYMEGEGLNQRFIGGIMFLLLLKRRE